MDNIITKQRPEEWLKSLNLQIPKFDRLTVEPRWQYTYLTMYSRGEKEYEISGVKVIVKTANYKNKWRLVNVKNGEINTIKLQNAINELAVIAEAEEEKANQNHNYTQKQRQLWQNAIDTLRNKYQDDGYGCFTIGHFYISIHFPEINNDKVTYTIDIRGLTKLDSIDDIMAYFDNIAKINKGLK